MNRGVAAFISSLFLFTAAWADAPRSTSPQSESAPFTVTTIAEGLQNPWGLALLPDGRMLVSERPGRLRLIDKTGALSEPLQGVPEIYAQGQGGMLDVAISPTFTQDRLIYFSFSEPGEGGAGTAVARARLADQSLEELEVLWRQTPKVSGPNHWGSRLVFGPHDTLFITMGDRYSEHAKAQDLTTTLGKVVRINVDGSIPRDNPFVKRKRARPEIWSYGHRNVQAATLEPHTKQLWTVEHGARGGDELNHPQAGRNYGWPVITYGVDYSGEKIGKGTQRAGMEQPVYYWDPVIAPSAALFYDGDTFPQWQGDLLVGSLSPGALVRLEMQNGRVVKESRYLSELNERIRDVQQGSDGSLYLLTDNPKGRVLKLEPTQGCSGNCVGMQRKPRGAQ